MKRMIPICTALFVALLFPVIAAAQAARISGQVLDSKGQPWSGVSITISNDSGQTYHLKTDKHGRYSRNGLAPGVYTFTLTEPNSGLNTGEQRQLQPGQNDVDFNFKKILAEQASTKEGAAKQKAEQSKFNTMKKHVEAGVAAFNVINQLKAQLKTAPAAQKAAIQAKLNTEYQTAIAQFKQAEPLVSEKDKKNHAVVWANLGQAYSMAGQYDDAVTAFQKAVALNPEAPTYTALSLAQANQAALLGNPAAASAKMTEAGSSCDKASALNPAETATCWKNLGIVLSNKGDLKDAIGPLQKATAANPKDAQAWFLLGSAYTGTIQSKQVGNKMTFVIPTGTAEAYEKCIAADPSGPYATQAKQNLAALKAMGGGVSTKVEEDRPSKKKRR